MAKGHGDLAQPRGRRITGRFKHPKTTPHKQNRTFPALYLVHPTAPNPENGEMWALRRQYMTERSTASARPAGGRPKRHSFFSIADALTVRKYIGWLMWPTGSAHSAAWPRIARKKRDADQRSPQRAVDVVPAGGRYFQTRAAPMAGGRRVIAPQGVRNHKSTFLIRPSIFNARSFRCEYGHGSWTPHSKSAAARLYPPMSTTLPHPMRTLRL